MSTPHPSETKQIVTGLITLNMDRQREILTAARDYLRREARISDLPSVYDFIILPETHMPTVTPERRTQLLGVVARAIKANDITLFDAI